MVIMFGDIVVPGNSLTVTHAVPGNRDGCQFHDLLIKKHEKKQNKLVHGRKGAIYQEPGVS